MARNNSTVPTATVQEEKPAQPASKPAKGVGIKELAEDLGKAPKSVRAAIRRLNGGPVVGRGGRYTWPSKNDKDYKALVKQLSSTSTEDGE